MKDSAAKYEIIKSAADDVIKEIGKLPVGLNEIAFQKANAILQYAAQRTQTTVEIEFDVKDKQSRFTYSEVLSFIELFATKNTEVQFINSGLVKTAPPAPTPGAPTPAPTTKTFTSSFPAKKIKVSEYKLWLHQELQKLSSASDNDEIELNN
jgi:hypothetical protein